MAKISVIVPVYNAGATLDRCVRSILDQTYEDFELILVDDGSKDGSGSICDRYAEVDSRVKALHKTNGGASSARNSGLDEAKGEWVTFCDADDWVDSAWLMTYVQHMHDCDLVGQGICFDKSLISGSVEPSCAGLQYAGTVKDFLNEMANIGIVGYTVIKCFKRSVIELNGLRFDTGFKYHEDEEFVLRYLACCGYVVSVETPGYNYIMPNFANKYPSVENGYYLYRSLYSRALQISSGELSKYVYYVLNSMMHYLIVESSAKKFMQRCRFMRTERRVIGPNVLKSNMFSLLKYAIRLDVTGFFSASLLTLYLGLKRIFKGK